MSRRSLAMFLLLSGFWGASYLFIKVALDDGAAPWAIVSARTALAAVVLLPLAAHMRVLGSLRGRVGPVVVLGLVQAAAPLTLIALGEERISSSLTGILVSSAPIFTFLLAFALSGAERASRTSLAGVAIGIVGVAILLGVDAGGGAEALGSVATLGVFCTGIAFVFFHSLVASEGPATASLVGYVAPGFSVSYGVVLLDESFTLATAIGLVLILGGSWLAAGGELPARRRDVAAACEPHGGADAAFLEDAAEGGDGVASRPAVARVGRVVGDEVDLERAPRLEHSG